MVGLRVSRQSMRAAAPLLLAALSVTVLSLVILSDSALGQHCAPITESYLSSSSIQRTADGLTLEFKYSKTGGRKQKAYQAYLVAYSDANSSKIADMTPQQAIAEKLVMIVDTQVITRQESRDYGMRWQIKTESFVERLITEKQLAQERTNDIGGWKSFQDEIRLAVFIPFLDDAQFSVSDELPEDKHECNYGNESALLFETSPVKITVCFGIVQAVRLKDGTHHLELNSKRLAKKVRP